MLAAFLIVYGILFLWISTREQLVDTKSTRLLTWQRVFMIFGFFYLLLAFTNVVVAQGNTLFLANQAPCENLVVNSTDVTQSLTLYEYQDSCLNREVPRTAEILYVILVWTVFLNFVSVTIGLVALLAGALLRW